MIEKGVKSLHCRTLVNNLKSDLRKNCCDWYNFSAFFFTFLFMLSIKKTTIVTYIEFANIIVFDIFWLSAPSLTKRRAWVGLQKVYTAGSIVGRFTAHRHANAIRRTGLRLNRWPATIAERSVELSRQSNGFGK